MPDDSLIDEFIVESTESLERVDEELVQLESDPDDRELLASVFRSIHSIKGACGFLEFSRLERVAHAGESLLSSLRVGAQAMNEEIASALLELVDAVRHMLAYIGEHGAEGDEEFDALVARLSALNEPSPSAAIGAMPSDPKVVESFAGIDLSGGDGESGGESPPPLGREGASAPATDLARTSVAVVAHERATIGVRRLGEILRDRGMDVDKIARALERQHGGDRRRLGELLVSTESIDRSLVDAALAEQKANAAGAFRSKGAPRGTRVEATNIRVAVSHIDRLMNLVGELVLARNQLMQGVASATDAAADAAAHRVDMITAELQESVMTMRMQPVGGAWSRFPRIVRDVSRACGKQVDLEQLGKQTELDKTLLEAISDPMTHLVRNAIDHGIETPEQRRAAGKREVGTLTLRSYHESGQVIIEIIDDGKGLDLVRIREKAVANGIVSAERAAQLGAHEAAQLIFHPGLSTVEKVSNISGRGVGMDVVKTNIESIGGHVEVSTELGRGTTVRIRIPLTLAIIPALIVTVDGDRFAIPQASLVELVRLEGAALAGAIEWVQGRPVHRLRGRLLPLVDAREQLELVARGAGTEALCHEDACSIVVVRSGNRGRFGFVVDSINDTEEIVVKPLDRYLQDTRVYAGSTIMGDGYVALILDVMGIARRASITSEDETRFDPEGASAIGSASRATTRYLVCESGVDRRIALELDAVDRLEEMPLERVERAGDGRVVQYRGRIMPLVPLVEWLGHVGPNQDEDPWRPDASGSLQIVVLPGRGGESLGLVVGNVADIVDEVHSCRLPATASRIAYSTTIGGRVTDVVDVESIIANCGFSGAHRGDRSGGEGDDRAASTASAFESLDLGTAAITGASDAATQQLCTFWVDGQQFAVDVLAVQEILRSKHRTRVPLTDASVEGLLNLRGHTVTVLDFGVCLGGRSYADRHAESASGPPPSAMNVVVRAGTNVTSLLVDRIGDVVHVPIASLEPVPPNVPEHLGAMVTGVQQLDDGLLLVIDVEKLAEHAIALNVA